MSHILGSLPQADAIIQEFDTPAHCIIKTLLCWLTHNDLTQKYDMS